MKRLTVICLAMLLVAAGSAYAQSDPPQPRRGTMAGMQGLGGPRGPRGPVGAALFERNLFPPEFVLRNQLALGLTDEQLTTIKRLLHDSQGRVIDAQAELARTMERLNEILEPTRVDEAAALSASDDAMRLEARVKREHLGLLVRVKNLLTEEQQETLRNLRPPRRAD